MTKRLAIGAVVLFSTLLLFSALLAVLAMIIASGGLGGQSSAGGTLASGRSVSASGNDWYLSMQSTADTATIKTTGRTIVVAPTAVEIDGRQVASLDAAAQSVTVNIVDGEVSLVADGKPVDVSFGNF